MSMSDAEKAEINEYLKYAIKAEFDVVMRAMCQVLDKHLEPLRLELAGKVARIDQIETHVRNMERVLRELAVRAGLEWPS